MISKQKKPDSCPYCKISFLTTDSGRNWPRIICMNCRYFYEAMKLRAEEKADAEYWAKINAIVAEKDTRKAENFVP